jgi:hypothetical protein
MSTSEQDPTECFICRKHREEYVPGRFLYQDELVYASHIGQEGQPT